MLFVFVVAACMAANVAFGRVNEKRVNAICVMGEDGYMTMQMTASFGTNHVDKVLAINGDTYIRDTNEVTCAYSGSFTSGKVEIASTVKLNQNNLVIGTNTCGARRYNSATNSFVWTIQLRENFSDQIYTELDRQYSIICSTNVAMSNFVTANIKVYGQDNEIEAIPVNPMNTLSVLELSPATNEYAQLDNSRGVRLRQYVKLRVQSEMKKTRIDNIDHHGIYVFKCDYSLYDGGPTTEFITLIGCATSPNNPFGLTNGFKRARIDTSTSNTKDYFQTETDAFILARINPPSNSFILTCYVGYCYLSNQFDCQNYCQSNPGRRKRSVEAEAERISIVIPVNDDANTTPAENNGGDAVSQSAVIAVGSALGILVLVTIVAFILILICIRQRRERRKWDNSSMSSQQQFPEHLTEDQIKPAKM